MSVQIAQAWFYEPAFKKRFDVSDRWMRKYLVDFADRNDEGRLLLSINYKCDMPLHDEATVDAATRSMKSIFHQGWSLLADECAVMFSEIQSMPGYYIFQLSDSVRAVVAKVDDRMFFLELDSDFLTSVYEERAAGLMALRLAQLGGSKHAV
jgi:hypothetical protein